jgi:hypothetical protein
MYHRDSSGMIRTLAALSLMFLLALTIVQLHDFLHFVFKSILCILQFLEKTIEVAGLDIVKSTCLTVDI